MDFEPSEEQRSLGELARQILEREVTRERLREVEASPDRIDERLWEKLAEANLLGLAVPDAHGGMGYGLLELCVLLQEVGRAVAPVPAFATLVLGGLPIARFGSEAQQRAWLPRMLAGKAFFSGALVDGGDPARARREGSGWVLEGSKRLVPAARRAQRILVPASTAEGTGIFLVDPRAGGVSLTGSRTRAREPLFALELAGVRVAEEDLLGGDAAGGARALHWLHGCALAAIAATQVGVSERALEITAAHLRERVQFGAPIGSFPAVQQRAADCWIDLAAMRWTAWRAAWRISEGLPAEREGRVAKFWAAEGGSRIANAAQHLHGGLGVDLDYPIHRYFLWSKSLELELGAAAPQLAALGREMAGSGPRELA
jgi:hypothetical protein